MTPIGRVAATLGLSEGQVYTSVTGLLVAVVLLALGLPAIRDAEPLALAEAPRSLPVSGSPALAEVISAPEPAPPAEAGAGSDLATSTPTTTDGPRSLASTPSRRDDVPDRSPTPALEREPDGGTPTTTPSTLATLGVREGRYASASGPLLPPVTPGTAYPVALRVGAPDKQSYLRLTGTGGLLRLALSTQPGHQLGTVDAVRACRIVPSDWTLEDGSSLAGAPEVDLVDCVLGRPGTDAWTFDLSGIDAGNGVALVPVGPATGTFQVVFTPVAP